MLYCFPLANTKTVTETPQNKAHNLSFPLRFSVVSYNVIFTRVFRALTPTVSEETIWFIPLKVNVYEYIKRVPKGPILPHTFFSLRIQNMLVECVIHNWNINQISVEIQMWIILKWFFLTINFEFGPFPPPKKKLVTCVSISKYLNGL